eukprot:987831_1
MPRILTPRRETSKGSLPRRRGSANLSMHSLPGSRSSLQKYSRRSFANDQPPPYGSSKLSLRRSSLKRTESSSHSLSQRGLHQHQAEQERISKNDKYNDVWNFEEPLVSQPPSLTSSDTSEETITSSVSSQSSLQLQVPPSPSTEARFSLHQYYAAHRRALLHQEQQRSDIPVSSARKYAMRRSSLQYPNLSTPVGTQEGNKSSSLPSSHASCPMLQQGDWGQFVDADSEEEDLASRLGLLRTTKRGFVNDNAPTYRLRR